MKEKETIPVRVMMVSPNTWAVAGSSKAGENKTFPTKEEAKKWVEEQNNQKDTVRPYNIVHEDTDESEINNDTKQIPENNYTQANCIY